MPELPEVETVVRDLRPHLVGRRLTRLQVSNKALRVPWARAWKTKVLQRRVRAVERRGKWILIDLEGPWLLVHLGMTGQFTVVETDQPRRDHTHMVFGLDDERHELRFRDVRRFGSVTYYPDRPTLESRLLRSRLGPEPFDVDPGLWRERLRRTRRNLKAVLLDQTIVAGVGNIYADEALHEARLHPTVLSTELTSRQADTLRRAVIRVLTRAIEQRGSSIRDYIGGSGLAGKFQDEHRVYGRTAEPCRRCGVPIERIVLAGRSTHYCPRCQKR